MSRLLRVIRPQSWWGPYIPDLVHSQKPTFMFPWDTFWAKADGGTMAIELTFLDPYSVASLALVPLSQSYFVDDTS